MFQSDNYSNNQNAGYDLSNKIYIDPLEGTSKRRGGRNEPTEKWHA